MPVMHTFTVHEHHVATAKRVGTLAPHWVVTCDTCSLSLVATKAIEFMCEHGVQSLTVDGCPIKRTS